MRQVANKQKKKDPPRMKNKTNFNLWAFDSDVQDAL